MSVANTAVERFSSFAALQAAHDALLAQRDQLPGDQDGPPEFWAAVGEFVRRGQATGALLDITRDRRAAQSILDYWTNTLHRAQQPVPNARLAEFDPALAPQLPDEPCPYQGLAAFEESDARFFFGRERQVQAMIDRLAGGEDLLAVVGSSGSGKSSLVMAGLLPALRRGALPGSEAWCIFTLAPGSRPLDALAHAVLPPAAVFDDLDLLDKAKFVFATDGFRREPDYLANLVALGCPQPVVLVVDQFEELFTLCDDEEARQAFASQLMGLLDAPQPHVVVLTMRTDFVDSVARLSDLWPRFRRARIDVDALDINELRAAIEQPAAQVGLRFEEGIVDDLIATILGEHAGLPLLQFTLLKLWQNRQRNRITRTVYAQVGNPRQALERSAEDFYTRLIPEEQRTVRRLLLRLVRPGEGREFTSSRVRIEALFEDGEARDRVARVLDRLVNEAQLLKVTGMPPAEIQQAFATVEAAYPDAQVEVAHEALVRNWPRLVDWLDEERDRMRQRLRLTQAAAQWEKLGKDPDALWRGALLEEAQAYSGLSELEQAFIAAGEEKARQEYNAEIMRQAELLHAQNEAKRAAEQSQRKTRTIRRLVLLILFLLLLPLVWGIQALRNALSPWQPVENFPRDVVTVLAFASPASADTAPLFCAGALNIGVGCSSDGTSWNIYQQGLPTGAPVPGGVERFAGSVRGVGALAIDPTNTSHLLAFVLDRRVYQSINGGVTWQGTALQLPRPVGVRAMAVLANLAFVVDTNLELHATQDGGESWQSISRPGAAPFDGVYDVLIRPEQRSIYLASETGLWQSPIDQPFAAQKVADLRSVRFVDGAPGEAALHLLAFDQAQWRTTVYRWDGVNAVAELAVIRGEPRALAVDPDVAGEFAAYVLHTDGKVWAVANDGRTQSLGNRPGWLFYMANEFFSRASDLVAAPAQEGGNTRLFMAHSHGLLEHRLSSRSP